MKGVKTSPWEGTPDLSLQRCNPFKRQSSTDLRKKDNTMVLFMFEQQKSSEVGAFSSMLFFSGFLFQTGPN